MDGEGERERERKTRGTKRSKEPVLPKPPGENTITPLPGRGRGGIMNLSLAT